MSTTLAQPAQAPVSLRHQDTLERWEAALARAKSAGVKVYELGRGRYAVTSAHDTGKAYEVTTVPETCSCPAALGGDPVCLHRAAVRDHLNPQPEPPAHGAYDPDAEALQWAYNDRDRAYRDLDRYNALIATNGAITASQYRGFLVAQEREQDASTRIAELTAKRSLATVASDAAKTVTYTDKHGIQATKTALVA
jgi:hypothetical protein